jgi:hypothetical protein
MLSNPGYTGSPSYTFNPALSAGGTFVFNNAAVVTPYSGYSLNCVDCASTSAALSLTVIPTEAIGTASATACVGQGQTLNMFTLSGSAVTNGSWYYYSGPNPTQSVIWNGVVSTASPNTLLSVGQTASLQTSTLAEGVHVFRYVTSVAPCLRYKDITVTVSLTPTAGIASTTTICGGTSCAPITLNSLVSFETTGGTFGLTTAYTGALQVSISGAAPVTFNNLNPLTSLPYNSTIAVTSFPSTSNVTVSYTYSVSNGGCTASSSNTFTIAIPNSGMSVISNNYNICLTTPAFLLSSNIAAFKAGGLFSIRYKSSVNGVYASYTGAAFTNRFTGTPPPPNSTHSLTAGFSPSLAASGFYEVTYQTYSAGGVLCTECQGQTITYVFYVNGSTCGCSPECDIQPAPAPTVSVCTGYTCGASTFSSFNVASAISCALNGLAHTCPVNPNYARWRYYLRQGPPTPTINGVVRGAYPIQITDPINWSTSTPGTYLITYEPQINQTGGLGYEQDLCYTRWEAFFDICPPSPCSINITSLTYNAGTITSAVSGCTGTVTYAWTGPSGFTAATANITPNRIGTYTLTATCTDGSTCTNQASITIGCAELGLSVATSGSDITASLTGPCAAPVVYTWTRPGGTTTTGATIVPSDGNGIYSVTSSCNGVATGCTATYTCGVTASISNNGSQLIGSASGCGASSGNYSYSWSRVGGGFTATTPTITPTVSGTYNLFVSCVDSGCIASASASFTLTCNLGVTIAHTAFGQLEATGTGNCTGGIYSYSWNAQPSNVTTTGSVSSYVPGQTYTVTLTCIGGSFSACPAATAVYSCPNYTVSSFV